VRLNLDFLSEKKIQPIFWCKDKFFSCKQERKVYLEEATYRRLTVDICTIVHIYAIALVAMRGRTVSTQALAGFHLERLTL
jgi:hypothetical protein